MKLLLGDCLDLMPTLADASIDLILADLPYGTTDCKWDSAIPLDELWGHYKRLSKPHTPIVLFGSQPFTSILISSNLRRFRHSWIWDKKSGANFLNAKHQPIKQHEEILVFAYGKPTYNPQKTLAATERKRDYGTSIKTDWNTGVKSGRWQKSKSYDGKTLFPKSILVYSAQTGEMNNQRRLHPTQKPVALLEYLIKTYSNPGAVILDNAMGSGSCGVAAKNTGREFIGIESDKKIFNVARQRLGSCSHNYSSPQTATLLSI